MPEFIKSILSKLITIFALLSILTCPVTFIVGIFAPQAMGVLDPILCPPGMHLVQERETRIDDEGDEALFFTYSCTDGEQEVDATLKMLLIFAFGLPILGGVLLFLSTWFAPSKTSDDAASFEMVEQPEIELREE